MERARAERTKRGKERRQRRPMEPRIKVHQCQKGGAESRVVYYRCIGLVWQCFSSSFFLVGSVGVARCTPSFVHHLDSLLETVVGVAGLLATKA